MIALIRTLRVVAALLAIVMLVAAGRAETAFAATYVPITGSGSTWSQNALDQWRKNVAANYGMTVNYSGVGSSAGRRDFIQGTVDYAVSEIPFQSAPEDGSAPERPANGFAYLPIVAGGTAFMYNLKISGSRVTNLRLSGEAITGIFTGTITKWNDPAIKADNPGLAMPDRAIVPVVRSDGSGSTAQFTLWMSKEHPSLWNAFCASVGRPTPCGLTSQYPVFGNAKAQNGSLGVSGYVSQDYGEGAITYVEYSYAVKSGFPVAKVLNASGYYVEPTASSVAVALMKAQINTTPSSPDYLTQILDGVYDNADKRSYPLSSYSYMIVPTEVAGIFTVEKGATLASFLRYVLCEGQQQAPALGYSPLPMNLVLAGSDQIKRIPGAGNQGIDTASCNNPTFKPGDSPSNNQLAQSAPQPAECDKRGPDQCTTGTAGATNETPVSGSGSGGSSTTGGGGSTTGDGELVVDENGDVIGGGGDGGGGGTAVSRPFDLPDRGMGGAQWLMIGAVVLLLLVIALPPYLSRRLRRAEGTSDSS
jgi:phosphate ABC transporter phosphate-binding protein